jgi:cytoskeletal protein RodZ
LVCGCLSLLCGIFASIPAIILGHMGRTEIKKNPALQGAGMAMAGMILGYVFTTLIVIYLISIVVLLSMGNNVKDIFKTINAQIEAAQATNSADQSATTPDQTTNAPDQTTPTPANTPDQSTNSAPAATNTPDQSTNSAPAATNSPDQSTNSAPATTNSPTPSTNAPESSTNAAPMNQ